MADYEKIELSEDEIAKIAGGVGYEEIANSPSLAAAFRKIVEQAKMFSRPKQEAIDNCVTFARKALEAIPFEPGAIEAYVNSIWVKDDFEAGKGIIK